MGVFGELFSFDGRINRLGYLWRTLLAGVLTGVIGAIAAFALLLLLRPGSLTGADEQLQWLITGFALVAMWSGAALASRRLRDMGLEPIHIVPLYAALWVVNEVLLAPLSLAEPQQYGALETGWALAQWVAPLVLLFWPSRPAPLAGAPAGAVYEPAAPTQQLNWRQSGG